MTMPALTCEHCGTETPAGCPAILHTSTCPIMGMVCCGCGKRFPHAELQTLGGGGPFCEPCAERIEAEIAAL